MSRSGAEIIASENRSKYIQSRISRVERDFGQICDTMSSYTRKTARLRDKGDKMCAVLRDYVDTELINMSMKNNVRQFTEYLASIQDYRQAQVNRLEANVVKPMCSYGAICKDAKVDIRASLMALDREQKSVRFLQKAALKFPTNETLLYRARADVDQSTLLSIRTSKDLQTKMDLFEKKKLTDLKKILTDFVKIEMMFHAKALELYTSCFHAINGIHPDADFMEFRKYVFPGDPRVTPENERAMMASQFCRAQAMSGDALSNFTPKINLVSANTCYPTYDPTYDPTHDPTQDAPPTAPPYTLVTTSGVPHYKMTEASGSVGEADEERIDATDDTDDGDELNDTASPRKRVTLNSCVKVVDLNQTL